MAQDLGADKVSETLTFQPQGVDLGKILSGAASYGWLQGEEPCTLTPTLVGDLERERSFENSISQIEKFQYLPPNWDTYGGLPAKEEPVRFSIDLLKSLQPLADISAPHVAPISSGVYIEWRNNDSLLYFEVDEDSVLSVMKKLGRTVSEGEDSRFAVKPAVDLAKSFHTLAP